MKNIYTLFCVIAVAISPILAQQGSINVPKDFIKSTTPNVLNIHVDGGDYGYQDNLYIYYWDGATTGYDEELESIKWYSINEDATMIWSIATDETELAINAMPVQCLYNGLTSIPIHFECGYDAEYTFTFEGFDSFEYPTEFWLQDITREDDWMSITDQNNTYTFQGHVSDENTDRFVMHFLDPTGITVNPLKVNPENEVHIRSSENYAIIETKFPQHIIGIEIFDLVGNEVYKGRSDNNKLQKIYVSNQHGYYFVKVITNSHMFTKKIFIGQ